MGALLKYVLSVPGMLKLFNTMLQVHLLMSTIYPWVSKQVSKQSTKLDVSVQLFAQKLPEEVVIRSLVIISSVFQEDLPSFCSDTPCVYFLWLQYPSTTDNRHFLSLSSEKQMFKINVSAGSIPSGGHGRNHVASPSSMANCNTRVPWLTVAALQSLTPSSLVLSPLHLWLCPSSYRNTHHVGLGPSYSTMTSS